MRSQPMTPCRRTRPLALNAHRKSVLCLGLVLWFAGGEAAQGQLPVEPGPQSEPLQPELGLFEPLIGTWQAAGAGFMSRLSLRSGATGRVVYAENLLRNESGEQLARYEGFYYWNPDTEAIEFITLAGGGERHSGHVDGGADGAAWHTAVVDGGSVDGYRSVLQPTSADVMEYRAQYASTASVSDVLASEPLVYHRVDGVAGSAAARSQNREIELPFDPPPPHEAIASFAPLEGFVFVCSVRYRDGAPMEARGFTVQVARRVFGQALSIDFPGQSSFLVYDPKLDHIRDVTASAIGAIEYWEQSEAWDDEVLAFELASQARFVIGDDPEAPVDFRKAYRRIDADGWELVYHLSADEGQSWDKVFHNTAVRAESANDEQCSVSEA